MFKLVLEKAEQPEIKLPTSARSWKKEVSSRKTSISALLTMPKPLTVWITINCGKFPASESFPMSQLFAGGGQSTGVSASASVLPMNIQD